MRINNLEQFVSFVAQVTELSNWDASSAFQYTNDAIGALKDQGDHYSISTGGYTISASHYGEDGVEVSFFKNLVSYAQYGDSPEVLVYNSLTGQSNVNVQ